MRDDYQNAIDNNFNVQNTQGVRINVEDAKERLGENYTCKDQNWNTDKYQGDIYISVPNQTHDLVVNHHNNPQSTEYMLPENRFPGVGGFFTNEETASKHFEEDGKFDSVGLGRTLQQAPHYNENAALEALANNNKYNPEYNGHLACFRVNEEKMQAHFGTTDFFATMSHCKENTSWGEGGGFQGYNPYISEMINKGALEYVPEKSRTCQNNECFDYSTRKHQASEEAKAVNNYIEKNHVQGKDGERLGFNELSQRMNKDDDNSYRNVASIDSKTNKVTDGGGNHAPPAQNDQPIHQGEQLASLDSRPETAKKGYEDFSLDQLDSKEKIDAQRKEAEKRASGNENKHILSSGKDGMAM